MGPVFLGQGPINRLHDQLITSGSPREILTIRKNRLPGLLGIRPDEDRELPELRGESLKET